MLGLYCNAFTGTLAALASLGKLQKVDTHWNFFTGPLPSFAKSAATLVYISVANNKLTGAIPADYAEVRAATAPTIRTSSLIPTPPLPSPPQLQALTTLGLAYNSLDGPLDVISKLPKLVVIFLRDNFFTGIAPLFHPDAQVVDIDNNQLNSLPAGICTGTLPGA